LQPYRRFHTLASMTYTVEIGGVDLTRYTMGPRTAARRQAYAKRRARLGTDEGRNDLVDACRLWAGRAMVRRANLDRRRGVRR
jgi:hypothetical protein